jgi:hypothetical protein
MLEIENYTGAVVSATHDGRSYVFPPGASSLTTNGGEVLIYRNGTWTGPSEAVVVSEWGTLVVADVSEFSLAKSPLELTLMGVGLAVSLFTVLIVFRIVKNIGKQSPQI